MRYLIVRVFNFNEGRLPMFRRYLSPLRNLLLVAAWVTVLFSLAMTATQGHAAAPAAVLVRVVGPANPVRVVDQFAVIIQVEGAANLGAFEFEYGANPLIASTTVADIQLGEILGSTGRTTGELRLASSPTAPGHPLYAAYSYGAAAGPSGNGQLATVTMLATGQGTSSLDLTGLKVTDVSGVEVSASSISGVVQVQGSTRPLYLPLIRRERY